MDKALPPRPADLWPLAHPAKAYHRAGQMLCVEIPGMSESLVLNVLSRAIHLEMRAAGEWAFRARTQTPKEFPSNKELARYRADNAARLLELYASLFGAGRYFSESTPTPESVKASATHCYQVAYRDQSASSEFSPYPISLQPKASIADQEKPMKPKTCTSPKCLASHSTHEPRLDPSSPEAHTPASRSSQPHRSRL